MGECGPLFAAGVAGLLSTTLYIVFVCSCAINYCCFTRTHAITSREGEGRGASLSTSLSASTKGDAYDPKIVLLFLVLLVGPWDLPMYVSLVTICKASTVTYALHKPSIACLYAAMAVVFDNWAKVISLYNKKPWLLHLWVMKALFSACVCLDVILVICFDVDGPVAITGEEKLVSYWIKFILSTIIAFYALYVGRKLRSRIAESLQHAHGVRSQLHVAVKRLKGAVSILFVCLLIQSAVVATEILVSYQIRNSNSASSVCWYWLFGMILQPWGCGGALLFVSGFVRVKSLDTNPLLASLIQNDQSDVHKADSPKFPLEQGSFDDRSTQQSLCLFVNVVDLDVEDIDSSNRWTLPPLSPETARRELRSPDAVDDPLAPPKLLPSPTSPGLHSFQQGEISV